MYLGNMTLLNLRRTTHDIAKANLKVEIPIIPITITTNALTCYDQYKRRDANDKTNL